MTTQQNVPVAGGAKSKSSDYFTRMSDRVQQSINTRAEHIASKLAPVMHSGSDNENVTQQDYNTIIQNNWQDPQWRANNAFQRGEVKMVQDALQAHGLPASLLRDNAQAIVDGLSTFPVDATDQFWNNMQKQYQDTGEIPASASVAAGGSVPPFMQPQPQMDPHAPVGSATPLQPDGSSLADTPPPE